MFRYIVVATLAPLTVSWFFMYGTSHTFILNGAFGAMWILSLKDALHIITGALIVGLITTSVSTMMLFSLRTSKPMIVGIFTTIATIVYWAERLS